MKWVECKDGHTVNEFIIETDNSCMVCRGDNKCPTVDELMRLGIGDALYYVKPKQNVITGKVSQLKLRHKRTFKTSFGVVERVR